MNTPSTTATTCYTVRLSHRANRDFRGGYWGAKPTVRAQWILVDSIAAASAACMDFISAHELGGGNWNGGQIRNKRNKQIARVSFNGRVWDNNELELI
jgi:hypothetical protein